MQLNFNAFDFDPAQGGGVCFPLADYKVEITAVEPKVVKDNPHAGYLEFSFTVTEGDLRGLVQKDRLNIWHEKEVPRRIANQRMSAIAFAINRPYVQTTQDFIGGRLMITAGPQEAPNEKYSDVKVVKCLDGSLPKKPEQGAPAAAPAPPAPPAPPASYAQHSAHAPQSYPPAAVQAPPAQGAPWNNAPQAAAPAAPPVQPAAASAAPPWGNAAPQPAAPAAGPATPPWAR